MRPFFFASAAVAFVACAENGAAPVVDVGEGIRPPRPTACEVAPELCVTICERPVFVAPPRVANWPAPLASTEFRASFGVFDAPAWWRHEPGRLVNYSGAGEELDAFSSGLAFAQAGVSDTHVVLSAPDDVYVFVRQAGGLLAQQVWSGVSARFVDRTHLFVEIGDTAALVTVADDGTPVEVACADLGAGGAFAITSRSIANDVMVLAGGDLVGRELENARIVLVALDAARFGSVLAETAAPAEASVQFIAPDTVEVFSSSGGARVDWIAIGEGGEFVDLNEPAELGTDGPSLAIPPHFVLRRDGLAWDLARRDAPRAVELTPLGAEAGVACRYEVSEPGGAAPQAVVLPQHFPGDIFLPADAPAIECGRSLDARPVAHSSEGEALLETSGAYALVARDSTVAIDEAVFGSASPVLWAGRFVVARQDLGTDFGLTVETELVLLDSDALGAPARSIRVPGRVRSIRGDERRVWYVSEGRAYDFGEASPPPTQWAVVALDPAAAELEPVVYTLPRGFAPVDAVPDHLDGAWIFGADQSVLHLAPDGEVISQSDIPPRTDPTTMTKAANAAGLVVADGTNAWWYDPFGIRRAMPGAGVFDILGADESSYWLLMSAVVGLPAGARGPFVATRARIEQGSDGVTLLEGDSHHYEESAPIGFGDTAIVSGRGGIVWSPLRAP